MQPLTTRSLCLLAVLAAVPAFTPSEAQTPFGQIHGSVDDDHGHPLPGVSITLSGIGADHSTVSNENGVYHFLYLDPGAYHIAARLDGYSTVEQPGVVVAPNRSTTIDFILDSAIEETITVTAESPLLDEQMYTPGDVLAAHELEAIPTPRDPWSLLTQAPGVALPRVNVGGSETGNQSAFVGLGTTIFDNDYLMDGIQITSMTFTQWSSSHLDFEQFETVEIATGGADVTKNTGGVSLNMVTRRGTNQFRGSARFLSARHDGLGFLGGSSSDVDCGDLHPEQDCASFATNRVEAISEYGFHAGGPVLPDRLWLWGSHGVNDYEQVVGGGGETSGVTENSSVKVNAQLGPANSAVASWNNGVKKQITGATLDRAPETRIDNRPGPTAFWRLEDAHVFGSALFVTGSLQKTDQGWSQRPLSGCVDATCPLAQETLLDSDGVWKQNFYNGWSRGPEEAVKLDASYFFDAGAVSHQLRFGGRLRQSSNRSNFAWPGRNIVHIAGENFGQSPGPVDFFFLYRGRNGVAIDIDYHSLWVQDTLAAGRWTVNAGLRYDLQDGVNQPGTSGPSAAPAHFPEVRFDEPVDAGFDWETVTPRLALTYAVGEERDTLVRTSFAEFPKALSTPYVGWLNPAAPHGFGAYAYFLFLDVEQQDNLWNGTEPYYFLFGNGYDPRNPTRSLNTVEEGLDPETTREWILAVEHSLLPELVLGLSYTWREIRDAIDPFPGRSIVRPTGTSGAGRPATAADYVPDEVVSGVLPDGSMPAVETFSLDPALEHTGFFHLENDSRSRRYDGITLSLAKRLSQRWSLRGYLHWGEAEWRVPQSYLDASDPNPAADGGDRDDALFIQRLRGRLGERYLQSSWQANLAGMVQIAPERPWGFVVAGNAHARQGHPLPYNTRYQGADGILREVSLIDGELDRFRLDDLYLLDLRVEKTFAPSGAIDLTLGVDLFNVLNEATPLSRETTLSFATGDYLLETLSPRIWKLGVRVSWR